MYTTASRARKERMAERSKSRDERDTDQKPRRAWERSGASPRTKISSPSSITARRQSQGVGAPVREPTFRSAHSEREEISWLRPRRDVVCRLVVQTRAQFCRVRLSSIENLQRWENCSREDLPRLVDCWVKRCAESSGIEDSKSHQ